MRTDCLEVEFDQVAEERSAYGGGHVKLHRALLDSSLWQMRPEDWKLATYLLLRANWKDAEWFNKWQRKRITVRRGELISSLKNLALGTGLSIQEVRTSIKHLFSDGFIEILNFGEKSTRQFTHIKISKYNNYQSLPEVELTRDQHATNTAPTRDQQQMKNNKNKEEGNIYSAARNPRGQAPSPRIHIDKLELTDSMKEYAKANGINGHVFDLFADMADNAHKKNKLTNTLRGWEAQFRTFVRNAEKFNPKYFDKRPLGHIPGESAIDKLARSKP